MEKSPATPENNPDQAGLKPTRDDGHSLATPGPASGVKAGVEVKPQRLVSSSPVFIDDLGTTLNEY